MKIAVRRGRLARSTAEPKRLAVTALSATWVVLGLGCFEDTAVGGNPSPDDGMTLDQGETEAGSLFDPNVGSSTAWYDAGWTWSDAGAINVPSWPWDAAALPPGTGVMPGTTIPGTGTTPGATIPGVPGTGNIPGVPGTGSIPGLPGTGSIPGLPGTGGIPGINIPGINIPGINIPGIGTPDAGAGSVKDAGYDFGPGAAETKLAPNSLEFVACYLDFIACNAVGATRDCVVKATEVGCLPKALIECVDRTEGCSPQTGLGPGISGQCTQVMQDCLCAIYDGKVPGSNIPGGDTACKPLPIDTSKLP